MGGKKERELPSKAFLDAQKCEKVNNNKSKIPAQKNMTTVKPRFHLPPDYYVRGNPGITLSVVGFLWIVFPIIAFFPNALDFIINDYFGDILERNSSNLVRLFNVQVWMHLIEFIVTVQKCREFAIAPSTTIKWLINVGVHGILALRYLLWPKCDVERIKVH